MKELDSFTVERLEELTALSFPPSHHELAVLARIALAAKRAEPVSLKSAIVKFKEYNIGFPVEKLKADFVISWCLNNLTPQLNSPEIPEGWKLVPNVVTTEMTDAARIIDGRLSAEKCHRIYRLMQAAAPESE
ncbi:TPA: hypothetical protein ACKGE9_002232 [Yersinia enterocolitica]